MDQEIAIATAERHSTESHSCWSCPNVLIQFLPMYRITVGTRCDEDQICLAEPTGACGETLVVVAFEEKKKLVY